MKGHRKILKHMAQPATGWYTDCSCRDFRGAIKNTKEQANADFAGHIAGLKRAAKES